MQLKQNILYITLYLFLCCTTYFWSQDGITIPLISTIQRHTWVQDKINNKFTTPTNLKRKRRFIYRVLYGWVTRYGPQYQLPAQVANSYQHFQSCSSIQFLVSIAGFAFLDPFAVALTDLPWKISPRGCRFLIEPLREAWLPRTRFSLRCGRLLLHRFLRLLHYRHFDPTNPPRRRSLNRGQSERSGSTFNPNNSPGANCCLGVRINIVSARDVLLNPMDRRSSAIVQLHNGNIRHSRWDFAVFFAG